MPTGDNSSFKIEVCMFVRGSVSDVTFQARKPALSYHEGGYVTIQAFSESDRTHDVGWTPGVNISLAPITPKSEFGCVGTLGGPFGPDTSPCVS